MIYRVRHDFGGEHGRQYQRGQEVSDPQWPNLKSLCEAGYIELVMVPADATSTLSDPLPAQQQRKLRR